MHTKSKVHHLAASQEGRNKKKWEAAKWSTLNLARIKRDGH